MDHWRIRVRLKDGTVKRYRSYDVDSLKIVERVGELHHGQISQMVMVKCHDNGTPVEAEREHHVVH